MWSDREVGYGLLLMLVCVATSQGNAASAADLWLADGREFPGQLWESRDRAAEQLVHRREATADRAFPNAITKLGAVAVGADNNVYFASGLDGYVIGLLDRRNEVLSFEYPGQIRDLDCGNEEHTVYFSVVPTPQNGGALADGKIYRRDIWVGQPSEVATVRQAEIGSSWWGAFAIKAGTIYVATLEDSSHVFKLTPAGPELIGTLEGKKVQDLAVGPDGDFYFTDGSNYVYRTPDFVRIEPAYFGRRHFSNVAVGPSDPAGS